VLEIPAVWEEMQGFLGRQKRMHFKGAGYG